MPPENFFMTFVIFFKLIYFQKHFSGKILSGIPSQCQTVWIQIRTDIQTVSKGHQQMTLVDKEKLFNFQKASVCSQTLYPRLSND